MRTISEPRPVGHPLPLVPAAPPVAFPPAPPVAEPPLLAAPLPLAPEPDEPPLVVAPVPPLAADPPVPPEPQSQLDHPPPSLAQVCTPVSPPPGQAQDSVRPASHAGASPSESDPHAGATLRMSSGKSRANQSPRPRTPPPSQGVRFLAYPTVSLWSQRQGGTCLIYRLTDAPPNEQG